jgi:single-strand DNA-binding protein
MIKLSVIGHLGKDAVVNQVNGKSVINFGIAHTEKYKDAQGVQKEKTLWTEAAYWSDKTKIADFLKKGTQVYCDGQPDVRQWESNGKTGASLVLRVQSVQLLGSSNSQGTATTSVNNATYRDYGSNQASSAEATEPLDDLPF